MPQFSSLPDISSKSSFVSLRQCMMRLVNDDQSGGIPPYSSSYVTATGWTAPSPFRILFPFHTWPRFLYLLHQLPAVRHYPDTGTGTVEEFPHHRRQQMSLSCACRHLHHDTLMKLPLLKEPGTSFPAGSHEDCCFCNT